MSSIAITTPVAGPRLSAGGTRLRITARGRRVLLALITVPVAAGIAFSALSGGVAAAAPETAGASVSFETITVMPGDTLWTIAGEIAPGVDPREVIDGISRLNQLRSSGLMIGQRLAIPAEYSTSR